MPTLNLLWSPALGLVPFKKVDNLPLLSQGGLLVGFQFLLESDVANAAVMAAGNQKQVAQ
jgi:hypothetical protein